MNKCRLFKNEMVLIIILLFFGANIVPTINGNTEKDRHILDLSINENMDKDIFLNKGEQKLIFGNPPDVEWAKVFGIEQYCSDSGYSVKQTTDGGYIIAGFTTSFDIYDSDVWLIKTDSDGNEEWNNTFGGSKEDFGKSVQQTIDGGYIIAGYTNSFGYGSYDVWLIKTDSKGIASWKKTFGGPNKDYGESIQQTNDGGYSIFGYTSSFGAGGSDVWLIKTDSDGNEEWNNTFGGINEDLSYSGQQTSDGGYILVGETISYGAGDWDAWIIKTDSDGNEEWNRTIGESGTDWGESIQQTMDDGFIITGSTTSYNVDDVDVWLIKTDINGNEEWNKTFSSTGGSWTMDLGHCVQQTTNGGYIIVGQTATQSSDGLPDVWLIKTDSDGNEDWITKVGDPLYAWGNSVQQTTDGGYIITGYTSNGDVFGGNVWLVKFENEGYNEPPNKPTITGPSSGKKRETYNYYFQTTDPDDNNIYYWIDWGDNSNTDWLGPYDSGKEITMSHSWGNKGTYNITCKAKDIHDEESDWATLEVSMPKSRAISSPFFSILENHPYMFPLLRHLMGV